MKDGLSKWYPGEDLTTMGICTLGKIYSIIRPYTFGKQVKFGKLLVNKKLVNKLNHKLNFYIQVYVAEFTEKYNFVLHSITKSLTSQIVDVIRRKFVTKILKRL